MAQKTKSVTLATLAQQAGVSLSTVSLALNGRGRISSEVREKIGQLACELGYRTKKAALKSSGLRGASIGVLLDRKFFDLVDSYYFQILRGLQREAEQQGFQILFATVGSEHLKRGWSSVFPANASPNAAVVVGVTDPGFVDSFRTRKLPAVFVSAGVKGVADFDTVVSDDFLGMETVFGHLTALGHRKIAFLGGAMDQFSSVNRLRAFKIHSDEFLGEWDSGLIEVAEESTAQAAGFETCTTLLARHVPFTALVCMNDDMARGAVEALRWSGLRVPEDVSVVGFENKESSQASKPPLTTVQINCQEMGKIACELLALRLSELSGFSPLRVLVAPQLIVRASTAPVFEGEPAWTRSSYATVEAGKA